MKLNLLVGINLYLVISSVAGVQAKTDAIIDLEKPTKCPALIQKKEVRQVTTPVKNLAMVECVKLPEGKVSTVAALTDVPQTNASSFNKNETAIPPTNASSFSKNETAIAQILPPTDSNGNRIFRSTRSGPSYIGVGLNFGVTGSGNLGDRSFVILSKLGLTETISVRPSIFLLRDFATLLIPVTYDFEPQQPFSDFRFAPYLGGGIAIDTGSNSSYGPLLTAGVDIPLSSNFTINVATNLAFLRNTDLGIVVGVGYNF
ncbi:outer membrane protein [Pseudanabaena mucicola]|uniref:Outer membrane protein beta-barrel domain-containing protein n=1 Tax=Pseudanabaena mucicola FACHB-723 TaxID=2692860 RepID=A0ABR7ZWX8_9CYAN|nr:hypothetical protein [Pseudanabaena mucicola]MBD2188468.1 hypothetical protein [Pseudanabaena mucicola FACHB-723]